MGSTNNRMRKQKIVGGRCRRTPPNRRSWSSKDASRHHRRQPRLAPLPKSPVSLMDATATIEAYRASRNHRHHRVWGTPLLIRLGGIAVARSGGALPPLITRLGGAPPSLAPEIAAARTAEEPSPPLNPNP